jgi:hypothetical protein
MKKNDDSEDKKLSKQMEKELSPAKAIIRITIGFFVIFIWILIGVNLTIIFTTATQQFMGFTSYFIRNPIVFLLIAFFNIFIGLFAYLFTEILWWCVFHLIWSIRWFYGYFKYRKVTLE